MKELPMKTVLYIRVSDPDQNLARQEKELRQYAKNALDGTYL